MNRFRLTSPILMIILFLTGGCVTRLGHNPLEGWKELGSAYVIGCPFDHTIRDDYQNYIQNLSAEERRSVSDFRIKFFESGTGQRAVTIQVDLYGTFGGKEWTHVLIYDQTNKGVKSMKYLSRRFLS